MPSVHAVVVAALVAAASTKTKSSSSAASLLFIVVLVGLAYVFFIRPRSQAARRQRDTLVELSVGDEVLTGAGIFGRVLDVEADRVTIETAPGTRITVLRSTIARRITEPPEQQNGWHDEEREGVGSHEQSADERADQGRADPETGHDSPEPGGHGKHEGDPDTEPGESRP